MTLDAVSRFNAAYANPADLIFDATAEQVDGVGGSGSDYQIITGFNYPPTLTAGVFISRFISGFDPVADTKTGIEAESGTGGWPIQDRVADLGGGGSVGVFSNTTLSSGTTYNGLHWWIDDLWYQRVFVAGTHTIQDAIDAAAVWPSGDAVIATNDVQIIGTTTPATAISFSGSLKEGAGAGAFIGTASADRGNGTFSEGAPALGWVDVAPNGQLTVSSGQIAPSPGTYSIQLLYDNSAVLGGGIFASTVPITVVEDQGETERFIPIPPSNINTVPTSLGALETIVAAFANNFSAARSTYGVPSGEPVIRLAAGTYGNLDWDNYNLSQRITVRGSGPFSHDGYSPTAGCRLDRILINNCRNIRVMGFWAEPTSISDSENSDGQQKYGGSNHRVENSQNVDLVRCAINGDVARSTTDLRKVPPSGVQCLIYPGGSSDCAIEQCSLIGYKEAAFGLKAANPHGSTSRWLLKGNVLAQSHNEGLVKCGGVTMEQFVVADTLAFGKGRASGAQHRDFIQITGTSGNIAKAVGWTVEGNWVQSFDAWGNDRYMAKQGCWWGAAQYNTHSEARIIDNFFGLCGSCIAGKHGNATVRFNTLFVPIDTLGSDSNDSKGIRPDTFSANIPQPSSWAPIASFDENIFPYKANSAHPWTGPNGAACFSQGFVQYNHSGGATANWDVMGAFLENYDDTFSQPMRVDYTNSDTSANNGKYQVVPREVSNGKGVTPDLGVEQYRPKAGSRAHWDHGNPTGCFQLFKRVFDGTDHDHWKDWGWPTAVTAHIYYDPNNEMGGASGAYANFDGNGVYTG